MARIWWNKPVTVETRKVGQRATISSIERASEYLLHEWPTVEDGPAFNACREALLQAYDGDINPEVARDAFIAALQEGNIYIFPGLGRATTGDCFFSHVRNILVWKCRSFDSLPFSETGHPR